MIKVSIFDKEITMKEYRHTQVGYLMIIAFGAAVLWTGYLNVLTRFEPVAIFLLALMLLCLGLFETLTVEVNDQTIKIKFGIGVIHKSFPLQDVEAYRVVKNPWYYFWGIRFIPGGLLFNVSGVDAVELQMKSGRKYRIGTDDAKGLFDAIGAKLPKSGYLPRKFPKSHFS
jgi:hypothetical protein